MPMQRFEASKIDSLVETSRLTFDSLFRYKNSLEFKRYIMKIFKVTRYRSKYIHVVVFHFISVSLCNSMT